MADWSAERRDATMDPMDSGRRRNRPHGSTAQVGPHGWKRPRRDETKRTSGTRTKTIRRMADRPRRRFRGPPTSGGETRSIFLLSLLHSLSSFLFLFVVIVSSHSCQRRSLYPVYAILSLASLWTIEPSSVSSLENCEIATQSEILIRSRTRVNISPLFSILLGDEEKVCYFDNVLIFSKRPNFLLKYEIPW